ncbi:hypothetical protein SKAU_G00343720 [Synaphobranchus kaupii]|uniref:Translation machinery-associated protein 16 n=1 Tax=Synaphobranchus kaupii TaxID=118154 RepID=A0A9Q1EJ15_SYNKA|nr:hypothetical protein SKAU_G00343720 [Synaphobranchus kaupii]
MLSPELIIFLSAFGEPKQCGDRFLSTRNCTCFVKLTTASAIYKDMPKGLKGEKKEKLKHEKSLRLNAIGEKLLWFQSQLDPAKTEYTKQDVCDIIERYLHRFDAELEQIELVNGIKGRQGRLHGSRENVIKQTVERERALYEGNGFEIPDIINCKHLKTFSEWNGDLKKLPNIKLRKVSPKEAENPLKEAGNPLKEAGNPLKEAGNPLKEAGPESLSEEPREDMLSGESEAESLSEDL